jgi:uncharacterized protein
MELASGAYLDLLDPDPALIRVTDIAHHLAQINRYTGATRRPMSVAEHTILVADRLRALGYGAATILRGLHHDDAEAYAGDVGRPLKRALGAAYAAVENTLDEVICDALDLPMANYEPIKAADDWALAAEAWHLLPSRGEGWFCWGLYDPDDRANPPAESRLLDGSSLSPETLKLLWLGQHERWMRHLHPPRAVTATSKEETSP